MGEKAKRGYGTERGEGENEGRWGWKLIDSWFYILLHRDSKVLFV